MIPPASPAQCLRLAAGAPPLLGATPEDEEAKPPQPAAWWADAGFDAKPLLKLVAEREAALAAAAAAKAAAAAAAAAQPRSSTPSGVRPGSAAGGPPPTPPRSPSPVKVAPSPAKEAAGAKGAGKDGGDKDGGKKGSKKGEPAKQPRTPPALRLPGTHASDAEVARAQELAGRLLSIPAAGNVAALLSRCSAKVIAQTLNVFLGPDPNRGAGAAVCARLCEAMPPVSAAFLLFDMLDSPTPLLPGERRRAVLGAMRRDVAKQIEVVAREVNALALRRSRQAQHALSVFLSRHVVDGAQVRLDDHRAAPHCPTATQHGVSDQASTELITTACSSCQVLRVLKYLRYEPDRVAGTVALWNRCVERSALYEVRCSASGAPSTCLELVHWRAAAHALASLLRGAAGVARAELQRAAPGAGAPGPLAGVAEPRGPAAGRALVPRPD